MGFQFFLLMFITTVVSMLFLCYIRGGMEPLLVMVLIGGLGITTLVFLSQVDSEDYGGSRYASTKYDKVHLNFNQTKVTFVINYTLGLNSMFEDIDCLYIEGDSQRNRVQNE